MLFRGVAQMVEHNAGLHAGDTAYGIDLEDLSHVLCEVEDDRDIAALSRERSASSAAENGSTEIAADGKRGENVVGIVREHDPNRNLAIVGAVGGVKGPRAAIKADFAGKLRAQGCG
jgi:hypothetical protein